MLDAYLVRHCAPTLAGLKCGNLFSYRGYRSQKELKRTVQRWDAILSRKGVSLTVLHASESYVLLYVYRWAKLLSDWSQQGVRSYLTSCGYRLDDVDSAISHLAKRIGGNKDFPHEIGLFLGYPLEDVLAFIENEGQNCKCCGCWKVYYNEEEAQKQFARFQKCTQVYCKCFLQGTPLTRLTVAC